MHLLTRPSPSPDCSPSTSMSTYVSVGWSYAHWRVSSSDGLEELMNEKSWSMTVSFFSGESVRMTLDI